MPVGGVLMSGIHRPRMAGSREGDIRHIKAGEDLDNAADLLRLAGIHGSHKAVGDGRMLDAHIQCVRRDEIFIIFRSAGSLVKGVHSDFAFSYDAHCVPSIFPSA